MLQVDAERHQRIRVGLHARGVTLADVARQLRLAAVTVTTVSQGYRRSRRIEAELAQRLGTTPEALFPERYSPKGGADSGE